ncbi:MAG TPA: uracil-DNA glycosylase, partial [Piscinibacter sp.]|nr:uracil-DNA glycosylase [Piscinibacter sp.]
MAWSERQRAMLDEMGVRLWLPPETQAQQAPVDTPQPIAEQLQAVVPVAPSPRGDRPTGVDAMDWPALREAVTNCSACKLCQGRRQTVFGVGHPHAHWMVVGEAPGEQEDRQGEPFVGKSGQLLDNMLRAIGLTRAQAEPAQQVYI